MRKLLWILITGLAMLMSLSATGCVGNRYAPNKGTGGRCAICGKGPCSQVSYNNSYYCLEHYGEAYYYFENKYS